LFAVLRAQPRGLAAVFRDLVGLLLLELRRDMGLGPALVGAFLSFLLSLLLPLGIQLRRILFFRVGALLVRFAPLVGFLLVLRARLIGLTLLFLALGGLVGFGGFLLPGLLLLFLLASFSPTV
jgi:hypothetical protein